MKRILIILTAVFAFIFVFSACAEQNGGNDISDESEEIEDEDMFLGYKQITQEEAKHLMDTEENYIILDVRTQEEYDKARIPNSLLIPDYEIAEKAPALLTDKEQLILVYCRSGNRSKSASKILADMGYTNIQEFGGITTWQYEIEK